MKIPLENAITKGHPWQIDLDFKMENTPWKMRSSRHSSGFQNKAKFLFYAIYFEIRLRYKSELSEHDCPNDPVFQKKKSCLYPLNLWH